MILIHYRKPYRIIAETTSSSTSRSSPNLETNITYRFPLSRRHLDIYVLYGYILEYVLYILPIG